MKRENAIEWTEVSPYDEIVGEAYKNYMNNWPSKIPRIGPCLKEEFINKCKTDNEFSKTWELKIEERELSSEERHGLFVSKLLSEQRGIRGTTDDEQMLGWFDKENIPTKLITITYKNETIEVYE